MTAKRRGRGEGSIERLPSGRFRAVVSCVQPDGRRVRRSKAFPTKREALVWLRGQSVGASSGTVGELFDHWLADVAARRGAKTLAGYREVVEKWLRPHAGRLRAADLTTTQVAAVYASLRAAGCQPFRLWRAATLLSTALRFGVRRGLLASNPAAVEPKPPRPKRNRVRVWEPAEEARFFGTLGTQRRLAHYRPVFTFARWTGLRLGELAELRWGDVTDSAVQVRRSLEEVAGVLRVIEPKTRTSVRAVPLCAAARAVLAGRRAAADELVFPAAAGGWMRRMAVCWAFRRLCRSAGVPPIGPHGLRHTFATGLLRAGVPVTAVSRVLGHSSPAITLNCYSHALRDDDAVVLAALDADRPTVVPRPTEPRPESGSVPDA